MTDREFDLLLQEDLSRLPPAPEVVNAVKEKLALAQEAVLNKKEAEKPTIASAWEVYNSLPQSQKLDYAKKHKDELK